MKYTFVQKTTLLKFLSILQENCGSDIINRRIKCKSLGENAGKTTVWFNYTFAEKTCFLDVFIILEKECDADINHGTFKCKFFFADSV